MVDLHRISSEMPIKMHSLFKHTSIDTKQYFTCISHMHSAYIPNVLEALGTEHEKTAGLKIVTYS